MATSTTTTSSKEVTVDQMDYSYIDKCSDEKELERILRALRSGREGFYPDLIEHCEKKLESINPQSRILRKQQPILKPRDLDREQQQNLNNELDQWTEEMNFSDPKRNENKSIPNGIGEHDKLPPVRGSHVLKGNKKKVENSTGNPHRIKSNDYKAWDRYDVDKECEKVDEEAEQAAPQSAHIDLPTEIDASGLTEEEREMKAVREKEKGNEAFKSGDFDEALSYYCRSISLRPIAASFNNRALVYLRLERWQDAKNDCNTVLSFDGEGENLKAMLRRATACKALGLYSEAKRDLQFVLDKEPNNARAKSILADVEKLIDAKEKKKKEESLKKNEGENKPGKKMAIQEVDGDSEEDDDQDAASTSSATVIDVSKESSPKDLGGGDSTKESNGFDKPRESVPLESTAFEGVDNSVPVSPLKPEHSSKEEVIHAPPVEPRFPVPIAKLKAKAGDFFRSGNYSEACQEYTKAIEGMATLLRAKNVHRGHELAHAVLLNNRAACWLKQGNDKSCVEDCTKVLEVKTWDVKAFTRRAVAYEHMEKYALAWADYQSAYNMGRENALAQNGANRVAKHLREIHGSQWREKLPKVHHYPHNDAHAWAVPSHTKAGEGNLKTDDGPPPQNGTSSPKQTKIVKTNDSFSEKNPTKSTDKSPPPVPRPTATVKESEKKSDVSSGKKTKNSKKRNKSKAKLSKKNEEKVEADKNAADVEKRKHQIRRDLFEKLKSEGNGHVKTGDYTSAIDCYTRCITLCPKETASYTNRALCFLKLKKHISAINDCTEAIKLDPVNVKAYYRRALARKAEKYYKDAERDIKKLLEIDPENKPAKNELDNLKKVVWDAARAKQPLISENERKKTHSQKKKLVIEEVDSSSSDEGEFILPKDETDQNKKTRKSVSPKSPAGESKGDPDTASKNSLPRAKEKIPATEKKNLAEKISQDTESASVEMPSKARETTLTSHDSSEKVSTNANDEKSRNAPGTRSLKEKPSVSESQNKTPTPYEFGNAWNAITDKSSIEAYKVLLDPVTPEDLPQLISNKIDDQVILVVAQIALEYAKSNADYQRAYDLMYHLTKAKRFSMAAMFLTDAQQVPLRAVFELLSEHCGSVCTKEELAKLKDSYSLS